MGKPVIIEVKDLTKSYGDFLAVDHISFQVFESEIFGLLGPNGAGKTTTLEMIETLRPKTSGQIRIDGISIDENPNAIKNLIGVQLQAAGYSPNLKLLEIMDLFSGLYGVKINARELLEKVALQDKAKSRFKELSGGQKQRFSIATTLINQPKVIFLDEPTTGLDPQARRNLWDLLFDIRKSGTTLVITTHYMDEAEILCDRVGFINQGKLIKIDTPDHFIQSLIDQGFQREKPVRAASLEDVFIHLTGTEWKE